MIMTGLKAAGAAVLLSMMIATPVFAQAAIQEPGAFAFYHPNADVLNGGAPTPAAGAMAAVPFRERNAYAYMAAPGVTLGRRVGSRHAMARSRAAAGPQYAYGPRCIPAPRVGAFATQPW